MRTTQRFVGFGDKTLDFTILLYMDSVGFLTSLIASLIDTFT